MAVDQDVVRGAALVIAEALASEGCATYEFCPGDMTRYDLAVVLCGGGGAHRAVVALPNFGSSYWFELDGGVHPAYVAEKLFKGQYVESSAVVIADLLNVVAEFLAIA